ncbi:MAG: hypothetical protein QXE23_09170 [Nitrososphaerota archaeon]
MPRRRVLAPIEEHHPIMPFQANVWDADRGDRGGKKARPSHRTEAFAGLMISILLLICAALISTGQIAAQLVGMIAFALLVLSTLLILGNYLIGSRKLTRESQVYFWIFAVSVSLVLYYLVTKGVIPLMFGGMLGQLVGIMQFEVLVSWLGYAIIAICIIGGIALLLLSPKAEE